MERQPYPREYTTKLRLCRLFKTMYAIEPFLDIMANSQPRKSLCKFRIGCHQLKLETNLELDVINSGRFQRPVPPPTERLCKQCTVDCVENEIHFLIECQKYTLLREVLYREVITIDPDFTPYYHSSKKLYMSSDSSKITHSVLLFISQAEQIHSRSLVTHVHA